MLQKKKPNLTVGNKIKITGDSGSCRVVIGESYTIENIYFDENDGEWAVDLRGKHGDGRDDAIIENFYLDLDFYKKLES